MTQDWAIYVNSSTPFSCVYFDQKNAFDKVQHDLLISKMSRFGIHEQTVKWCNSFLRNRCFRVKVDEVLSEVHLAPTGVPQGSSLSPLFYLIFISDIHVYLPKEIKYLVYADDLKIYSPITSSSSHSILQTAIKGVSAWCLANGMLLSPTKCTVLNYRLPDIEYVLSDGVVLPTSEVTRDLAVHITASLDLSFHVHKTIHSASILINTIFRCFIIKNPAIYIHLYKSLVLTKFQYCSPVWFPYLKKHRLALDRIYQKFVRRLRWRCGQHIDISSIPCVTSSMETQDERTLFLLKSSDLFDYFFNVTPNDLRSMCTISPKSVARSEHINNLFSWRMARRIHKKGILDGLRYKRHCT